MAWMTISAPLSFASRVIGYQVSVTINKNRSGNGNPALSDIQFLFCWKKNKQN